MLERVQTRRDYLIKSAVRPLKVSRKTVTKAVIAVTILAGVNEMHGALTIQKSQFEAFRNGYPIVNKYIPPKNTNNFSLGLSTPDVYNDIMGEQIDLSNALKSRIEEDIDASNRAAEKNAKGIHTNSENERCLIAAENWAKIYTAIEKNSKYIKALNTNNFSKLTLSERVNLDYLLTSMDYELKNIKFLENKAKMSNKQIMDAKEEIKNLGWKRFKLRWMNRLYGK